MAFGYRNSLERQQNGSWLVRFSGIPEVLTEGETENEARAPQPCCALRYLPIFAAARLTAASLTLPVLSLIVPSVVFPRN